MIRKMDTGLPKKIMFDQESRARCIEAVRSAGIACGSVAWGYAAPQALRAMRPDFMFERMEDITPERLVSHLPIAASR